MPVAPALLWPTLIEIARVSLLDLDQDDVFREPKEDQEGMIDRADKIRIEAQVHLNQFEDQTMVATGDDETIRGYCIIDAATQKLHKVSKNDIIIAIFDLEENDWQCFRLRITQVGPRAQKGAFGLYRANFKDDSKGT